MVVMLNNFLSRTVAASAASAIILLLLLLYIRDFISTLLFLFRFPTPVSDDFTAVNSNVLLVARNYKQQVTKTGG